MSDELYNFARSLALLYQTIIALKTLLVIVGPTASGKTRLAIDLAKHYQAEVFSADSRQIYTEMNIGTAKPSPDELAEVPHHFIGHVSIHKPHNAGKFEREALEALDIYFKTHDIAVLCGGTGLYIKALCEGMDSFPEVTPEAKARVEQLYISQGLSALQAELAQLDSVFFDKVDQQNPVRLMRALEVIYSTGQAFSSFQQGQVKQRPFRVVKIGLQWDKAQLHDRINQRVDAMMQQGLVQEVQSLMPFKTLLPLQTVGYQELFDYFEGHSTLPQAIELIKMHTRQYAKRQMTWFQKDTQIHWFQPSQKAAVMDFLKDILGS